MAHLDWLWIRSGGGNSSALSRRGGIPGGARKRGRQGDSHSGMACEKSLEDVQEMGQLVSDVRLFAVW